VGNQFSLKRSPIGPDVGKLMGSSAVSVQKAFKGVITQIIGKGPGQFCHQSAAYDIGNRCLSDTATLGYGTPALAA